jgi:hypothetical protein
MITAEMVHQAFNAATPEATRKEWPDVSQLVNKVKSEQVLGPRVSNQREA